MGSAQSHRAYLTIFEKFESPDAFNHCIVRLSKNDCCLLFVICILSVRTLGQNMFSSPEPKAPGELIV